MAIEKMKKKREELIEKYTKAGYPPNAINAIVDNEIREMILKMGPADMAAFQYPDAKLVKLNKIPQQVLDENLEKFSQEELEDGQFVKKNGKYIFCMGPKAKSRLAGE